MISKHLKPKPKKSWRRAYNLERRIFKSSSTSFFFSSLLFPQKVRKDVPDLYSFLRIADDYVDDRPPQPKQLEDLINRWTRVKNDARFDATRHKNDTTNERAVKNIVRLSRKHDFETKWIDDFLRTMKSDLDFQTKANIHDSLVYCRGSAEVVGLMMSRIMGLPQELDREAKLLGRAFQWANFIRDIEEDYTLGRCYFPAEDLKKFKLPNLSGEAAHTHPAQFKNFTEFQVTRYHTWRDEAKKSFEHIPMKERLALEVACSLFDWTLDQIKKDPHAVYNKRIKPSRPKVAIFVFKRAASVYLK